MVREARENNDLWILFTDLCPDFVELPTRDSEEALQEMSSSSSVVSSSDTKLLLANASPARGMACGAALAVASQLGWGCYPVLARALQTQEPQLSTLELLVSLNALSATTLGLGGLLLALRRRWIGRARRVASATASWRTWRFAGTMAFFGVVIATRAVTNIASAAFAPAHWCVMVSHCASCRWL